MMPLKGTDDAGPNMHADSSDRCSAPCVFGRPGPQMTSWNRLPTVRWPKQHCSQTAYSASASCTASCTALRSMLHCAAACCSMLHCAAACCSVVLGDPQGTAVHDCSSARQGRAAGAHGGAPALALGRLSMACLSMLRRPSAAWQTRRQCHALLGQCHSLPGQCHAAPAQCRMADPAPGGWRSADSTITAQRTQSGTATPLAPSRPPAPPRPP